MEEKENEELKSTESIVNGEETKNTELNAEPEGKDKQNEELKSKDVKSTQTSEIQKEGEDTKNNETNVEQEQPEVLNDSAKKKKSKKPLIITIIVLVVLVLCALGGFFIWKYIKDNESVGTTWGDTYYAYLKEGTEQKDYASREKYGLQQNMSNVTLQFAEIEEDKAPAMIMNYEENDANYVNVYHINNENKVVNVSYKEPSKVELLYNIELKQYIWYVHVEKANEDLYMPIKVDEEKLTENAQNNLDDNVIGNTENYNNTTSGEEENTNSLGEIVSTEMTADITIGKDAETTVEKLDGTTVTLPKFDETFVKPEIQESQKTDIDFNKVDESELKDLVETTVQGYKPNEQIITEEVKEAVNTKIEEVEQKQEEMKEAEEELKEKELEEEMKVTNENIQSKLGEHLKWFGAAYLGSTYGWGTVYEYKEVNVKIPGEHPDAMVYELVGAKSKANMESKLAQYVSRSKFPKFKERADFMGDLKEYKGKVYWTNLGIGGGPYMKTKEAKVISSKDGITKVKLEEYSSLGEVLSEVITITFKYNEDTSKYLITDWSVKSMY